MKKIISLGIALIFSISAIAQITIKGTVVNDSIPLESASVVIKNSTNGIATNSKGQFKLQAKKGDTLSISYLGYKTKDLVVNDNEIFKVTLAIDNSLDEVVINAYLYGQKISCGTTGCYTVSRGCGFSCQSQGVSILEEKQTEKIKLYPNPSSNGIFQINLTEDYNTVEILVTNISGQTVKNSTYSKLENKLTVDLSDVVTGIYIINIIADGQRLEALKAIRS